MHQLAGNFSLILAMGLALFAAIASTPRNGPHIDDAILQLMSWQGSATEFAPATAGEPDRFAGP